MCGTIFAVLHNHNSSVSISHIAQRSNRSPQRSLEHLQEFPKLLSNPWFLERCEKISLQQLIIQSPNILGVGKNPPHLRNFTRQPRAYPSTLARFPSPPACFPSWCGVLARNFPSRANKRRRSSPPPLSGEELVAAVIVWRR